MFLKQRPRYMHLYIQLYVEDIPMYVAYIDIPMSKQRPRYIHLYIQR